MPWEVLGRGIERRAAPERRAFTTTGQNDGPESQRPILQRLFGPGIMDALGVRLDSVPVGRTEWPLVATGIAPAQVVEGTAAADAVAMTFQYANLRPKRLTGRYEYTHEAAATVADLEAALRRDLADAIAAKMSDAIINGVAVDPNDSATAANVEGFLSKLAAPTDPAAEAVYADYAGSHAALVDGLHASREGEVSSIIGTASYQHAAAVYQAGSGESGSEALMRRSAGCRASSYIPAPTGANMIQAGNLYHGAGPNGGGAMRGDSVAAMWPTLEVVRDIYSQASQGVTLTWVTLWDAAVAFRSAAYSAGGVPAGLSRGDAECRRDDGPRERRRGASRSRSARRTPCRTWTPARGSSFARRQSSRPEAALRGFVARAVRGLCNGPPGGRDRGCGYGPIGAEGAKAVIDEEA